MNTADKANRHVLAAYCLSPTRLRVVVKDNCPITEEQLAGMLEGFRKQFPTVVESWSHQPVFEPIRFGKPPSP